MRVVKLDGDLVREVIERRIGFEVAAQDVLQRSRDEKVLLFEPQLLAHGRIVIGVEHLGYALR